MRPSRFAVDSPDSLAFIDALLVVCKQHGMTLGHEDDQGAFIVEDYSETNVAWLRAAYDRRGAK